MIKKLKWVAFPCSLSILSKVLFQNSMAVMTKQKYPITRGKTRVNEWTQSAILGITENKNVKIIMNELRFPNNSFSERSALAPNFA